MTTTDEWVRERAERLASDSRFRTTSGSFTFGECQIAAAIAAFGQEAIERGKADAVAAEREATETWKRTAQDRADDWKRAETKLAALLARLENPDEAMVEAFWAAYCHGGVGHSDSIKAGLRTLAVTLTGQENSDG